MLFLDLTIHLIMARSPPHTPQLVLLHRSLVEIESITGNEFAVGNFLAEYLSKRGFGTQLFPLSPTNSTKAGQTRYNILAWPGANISAVKVLASSHIDTVPPFIPYSISDEVPLSESVISGRGSVDAKASVAAQVIAVEQLLLAGKLKADDIALLYVAGEETTGDGMRSFSLVFEIMDPKPKIEAAMFGEPTENKLACGHKGFVRCTVTARGKSGHSGYPWLGKSANDLMVRALSRLRETDLGSSSLFGNTTINIGVLYGGVAANIIPESALAELAIRVAIGPQATGAEVVVEKLRTVLESIDSEAIATECVNGYGVIECDCNVNGTAFIFAILNGRSLNVDVLITDHRTPLGFETGIMNYGTDIPNFKLNAKKYLYGPGIILVAHSDHEAIKLAELEESVEGYKKLILHALANPSHVIELDL